MRILYIKIRRIRIRVRICWCTIKVQPNTLVNFKRNFCTYFYFLSFTLQQIFTKDFDIVKFAHTFCFNDQCQTVSAVRTAVDLSKIQNANQIQIR